MSEDIREASWQAYREKMHALDAANDLAGRGLIPSYRDWHAGWDAAQQALAAHSGQPRLLAAVESVLRLCDARDNAPGRYAALAHTSDIRRAITDALSTESSNSGSEHA